MFSFISFSERAYFWRWSSTFLFISFIFITDYLRAEALEIWNYSELLLRCALRTSCSFYCLWFCFNKSILYLRASFYASNYITFCAIAICFSPFFVELPELFFFYKFSQYSFNLDKCFFARTASYWLLLNFSLSTICSSSLI